MGTEATCDCIAWQQRILVEGCAALQAPLAAGAERPCTLRAAGVDSARTSDQHHNLGSNSVEGLKIAQDDPGRAASCMREEWSPDKGALLQGCTERLLGRCWIGPRRSCQGGSGQGLPSSCLGPPACASCQSRPSNPSSRTCGMLSRSAASGLALAQLSFHCGPIP